ncbi:hypothetical protein ACLX1H_009525 [Fusarium chlamydosporum]
MQPSRSGSFERRSSVNRRQSPSPSPIPTPSSRARTPSPSRGRPQSSRGINRPSSTRPTLRSRSRGRSASRSSSYSPSRHKKRSDDHHHHHGLFKTTAGLLAGIGVATVIAHKVWPKGVLYGGHEDWEHSSSSSKHSRRQPRRRSPENAERVYERTTRRHGDVVYHEEVSRRRPQNYERMPQEHVRIRQHIERAPYPTDDYYVQEQPFYPAEL